MNDTLLSFSDKANGDRYEVVTELGKESGVGRVYLARRLVYLPGLEDPVETAVALKVIKTGMDSQATLARFEAEGQILTKLNHPNIARIHKTGEFESAQPFIAMEFVDGMPLTEFCDAKALPLRQRLELFVTLCAAVHHAHQKGVIHRDLHPANLLVTATDDGAHLLKVIDFGIASAEPDLDITEAPKEETTTHVTGVPQYMSPEQLRGDPDIDTRSDVYSLGVILYELLTGTAPIGGKANGIADLLELMTQVRIKVPPTPSSYVHSLGNDATTISELRSTRPSSLTKLMRRELDGIVMKALEKDRGQRYDSASALATTVNRFLNGESIGSDASIGYLLGRFLLRHRIGVAAAAIIASLLIASAVVSWDAFRRTKSTQDEIETETNGRKKKLEQLGVAGGKVDSLFVSVFDILEAKRERGETGMTEPVLNKLKDDFGTREDLALSWATSEWNAGQPGDALQSLAQVLGDPLGETDAIRLADGHTLAGRIYHSMGEEREAKAAWGRGLECLAQSPDGDLVRLRKARLYGLLRKVDEMNHEMRDMQRGATWTFVELKVQASLLEARLSEQDGKTADAKKSVDQVLLDLKHADQKLQKNLPIAVRLQRIEALRYRAELVHRTAQWPHEVRFVEQDLAAALSELETIRSLDANNTRWLLLEAEIHQQFGNALSDLDLDLRDARVHYDSAQKILEDNLGGTNLVSVKRAALALKLDRSRGHLRHGNREKAEELLTHVDPGEGGSLATTSAELRGELAMLEEEFKSAHDKFGQALKLSDRDPWLTVRLEAARSQADPDGQPEALDEAVAALEEWYKTKPESWRDRMRLVEAYRHLAFAATSRTDAIEHLEKGLELLASRSMSLPTLEQRNAVRMELASHLIEEIEALATSPGLAGARVALHLPHHLGAPGAIIDAIQQLDAAKEEALDQDYTPKILEVIELLGEKPATQQFSLYVYPILPPGPAHKDAATSMYNNGRQSMYRGRWNHAGDLLLKAKNQFEELLASDPTPLQRRTWSERLAYCHGYLGWLHRRQGLQEESIENYWRGIDIRKELLDGENDPEKCAILEFYLAYDLRTLGMTYQRFGEPLAARSHAGRAEAMLEALSEKIPQGLLKGTYLEALGVSTYHRGMASVEDPDLDPESAIKLAKAPLRQSLRIREAHFLYNPSKPRWSRYLAQSLHACALVSTLEGDLALATERTRRAADLAKNTFVITKAKNGNDLHPWTEYTARWVELLNNQDEHQKARSVLTDKHNIGKKQYSIIELANGLANQLKENGDLSSQCALTIAQLELQSATALAGLNKTKEAIESLKAFVKYANEALDLPHNSRHTGACPTCLASRPMTVRGTISELLANAQDLLNQLANPPAAVKPDEIDDLRKKIKEVERRLWLLDRPRLSPIP